MDGNFSLKRHAKAGSASLSTVLAAVAFSEIRAVFPVIHSAILNILTESSGCSHTAVPGSAMDSEK